jgi:cytochrome c oxidase cbb3-type subunit III
MKKIIFKISLLMGAPLALSAQHQETAADILKNGISSIESVYVLTGIVFFFFFIIIMMLMSVNSLLKQHIANEKAKSGKALSFEEIEEIEMTKQTFLEKLLQLKPLSTEKDKMMHHSYDGITELNNPTPPWFMGLFYITILFGIFYMVIYHFSGTFPLQEEELKNEITLAEKQREEYLKNAAGAINETNAVFVTSAKDLEDGKQLYVKYCVSCHGAEGQGGVGPNFADNYWIHGNKPADLFKVVSDGVPSKGMVSWKKQLNGLQIQNVISFIQTFKGTTPENAKEPQGELME